MMKTMHANEQIWLVKSGDRIIGPFFESALIQKLIAREIVVIDEVAKPGGRWSYIREEPAFTKTVEELWARSQGVREDTDIATVSNTESMNAEKTQTVTPFASEVTSTKGQMVAIENELASAAKTLAAPRAKQFSEAALGNKRKENKKNPTWVWTVAGSALLVAGYIYISTPARNAKPSEATFGKTAESALRADRLGDFVGSLKLLREAHQIRPNDPDISLRLANLTLKVDHQSVDARRIVNETLALTHDPEHIARGQTILALASKSDGDLNEAERMLTEVLKASPGFVPATFNLGMVAFAQNKFTNAQELFSKTLNLDSSLAIARFMSLRSEFEAHTKYQEKAIRSESSAGKYLQETALVEAAMQPTEARVQNFLNRDASLTDEYRNDPLLDLEGTNWKQLSQLCSKISTALPKAIKAKAMQTICEVKAGQKAEASQLVDGALARAPNEISLLLANAYLLLDFGKDEEAEGTLRMAMRQSTDEPVSTLMARACKESQNAICEREQWKHIIEKNESNVAALVGLARLEFESGNKEQALIWFEKARPIAGDYIPWLQLSESLGSTR